MFFDLFWLSDMVCLYYQKNEKTFFAIYYNQIAILGGEQHHNLRENRNFNNVSPITFHHMGFISTDRMASKWAYSIDILLFKKIS